MQKLDDEKKQLSKEQKDQISQVFGRGVEQQGAQTW
jgi:hypothetical protein